MGSEPSYRRLIPARIADTADHLQARIAEHFPGSGLSAIGAEWASIARRADARAVAINRPNLPVRFAVLALLGGMGALLVVLLVETAWSDPFRDLPVLVQTLGAAVQTVVFIGAAVLFLVTLEFRIRRRKALEAIAEIRAMAHIVDMHQLAKSPDYFLARRMAATGVGPEGKSPADLSRYLECCSELLSLMSKVCAVYLGSSSDSVLLDAVDDIEDLTNGLTRKIWQKIMILGEAARTG
jgi:hypothetical protein